MDDARDAVELRNRGFKETDLISFLNNCKDVAKGDWDTKKAQVVVDMLDLVRQFRDLSWVNL